MKVTSENLDKIYNPANVRLNERLIIQRKITPEQKNELVRLHARLNNEFRIAKALIADGKLTPTDAKVIAYEVREIEFKLQDNWNFERDENRHKYWYSIPGCTCPAMDNSERWGTPYHTVNNDCPYHGEPNDKVV